VQWVEIISGKNNTNNIVTLEDISIWNNFVDLADAAAAKIGIGRQYPHRTFVTGSLLFEKNKYYNERNIRSTSNIL
jgi:hypothetical protein